MWRRAELSEFPWQIHAYIVQKMNCKFQGKALEPNPAPFDVKGKYIFRPKQKTEFP